MRPTAWQWDLRARLCQLIGLVALAGLGISAALGAFVSSVVFAAVMFVLFVASVLLAVRSARATEAERAEGYSTIYDFDGFELRDGRTLEVLRTSDVAPEAPGRRSLLKGMISNLRKD